MFATKGKLVATLVALSVFVRSEAGQQYTSTVTLIEPPGASQDCLWFELAGVSQADPQAPGSPWFAIPRTQNGYNELYALILSAKLTGNPIQVWTTGGAAGGGCSYYSGVSWIIMQ